MGRTIGAGILLIACTLAGYGQTQQGGAAAGETAKLLQIAEMLGPFNLKVATASLTATKTVNTRELRVLWTTGPATTPVPSDSPNPPPPGVFLISKEQKYAEPVIQQQQLELMPGRLLVVAIDGSNRLKSWSVMVDPRIVRSEAPGQDGALTGQVLYLNQTEFLVSVPDDPEIVELRFYAPMPNAPAPSLISLGFLTLRP